MRQVTQSAFVRAAVERATKQLSSFRLIFEESVLWQLRRCPLEDAVQIPGSNPPVFVFETNAWRAEGIPPIRIGFQNNEHGIELVRLTLAMSFKKDGK